MTLKMNDFNVLKLSSVKAGLLSLLFSNAAPGTSQETAIELFYKLFV